MDVAAKGHNHGSRVPLYFSAPLTFTVGVWVAADEVFWLDTFCDEVYELLLEDFDEFADESLFDELDGDCVDEEGCLESEETGSDCNQGSV